MALHNCRRVETKPLNSGMSKVNLKLTMLERVPAGLTRGYGNASFNDANLQFKYEEGRHALHDAPSMQPKDWHTYTNGVSYVTMQPRETMRIMVSYVTMLRCFGVFLGDLRHPVMVSLVNCFLFFTPRLVLFNQHVQRLEIVWHAERRCSVVVPP